ncbi:NADH:flavin oxidoreductase/NADH oxidase [Stachybotrys elegans]|uniref:NADH:flavin oxidoreductase/NADH oxidase n=1 Tax=Stachybotrys elegans TaxID=80388 RepID=A0A8K0WIV6_9HYPO|nr:NADH:flavin oxidoreductase/NADH oxidase [Stachybotrys elegans]
MPVQRWPAVPADVLPLAQPLKLEPSGKIAKNRLMKASMAEGLATWSAKDISARGIPTKETIKLYQSWGEGKNSFGIINTGNIAIEYDMMNSVGDMVITIKDPPVGPRFEAFKALAAAAKAHGSLVLGQVAHPGGQLSDRIRKDTFAPSAIQLPPLEHYGGYAAPREATQADIDHVVASFAHAAAYLAAAGFDGMELHGGHGYLLAQFLSPRFNKRTDAYGGSLTNRLRIILDIAAAVHGSPGVPKDFILALKLNSVEFQEGGMTPSEARDMCAALADAEFDFIELTGGNWENFGMTWERESTIKREGFFLEFADVVVPGLGPAPRRTKAFITGGMRSAAAMVDALKTVDGVGLARPAAQEPRIARDILEGRITSAIRPIEGLEDLGRGFRLAGTQLTQVGKGEEPFDASDKKLADSYLLDFDKWYKDLLDDGDKLEHHGYIRLSTEQRPYGQAY